MTQVCSLAMCCRAPSIPEAQDLSRSSSNASSFASVVEENEAEEEYDTGQVGGNRWIIKIHTCPSLSKNNQQFLTVENVFVVLITFCLTKKGGKNHIFCLLFTGKDVR